MKIAHNGEDHSMMMHTQTETMQPVKTVEETSMSPVVFIAGGILLITIIVAAVAWTVYGKKAKPDIK